MKAGSKLQTIRRATVPPGRLGELIDQMVEENHIETGSQNKSLDRVRAILSMRMSQYNDMSLTEEETQSIAKSFLNIELGSSTNFVAICNKQKCLYKTRCELYNNDKCPEGKECILENKIMSNAFDRYIVSLNIDLNNYPEMVLVNQLTEYELIEFRCNVIMSYDHVNLKMKSVVGIDVDGNVITKEDISHALQIKMQVFKNKIQLLEAFTATRKESYKKQAALKETKDGHAKVLSAMKNKLKELKNNKPDIEDIQNELNIIGDTIVEEDYN